MITAATVATWPASKLNDAKAILQEMADDLRAVSASHAKSISADYTELAELLAGVKDAFGSGDRESAFKRAQQANVIERRVTGLIGRRAEVLAEIEKIDEQLQTVQTALGCLRRDARSALADAHVPNSLATH